MPFVIMVNLLGLSLIIGECLTFQTNLNIVMWTLLPAWKKMGFSAYRGTLAQNVNHATFLEQETPTTTRDKETIALLAIAEPTKWSSIA
jgi:hypothetical protein